jgi:hypothetical protein
VFVMSSFYHAEPTQTMLLLKNVIYIYCMIYI